jgi:hypothetical protein
LLSLVLSEAGSACLDFRVVLFIDFIELVFLVRNMKILLEGESNIRYIISDLQFWLILEGSLFWAFKMGAFAKELLLLRDLSIVLTYYKWKLNIICRQRKDRYYNLRRTKSSNLWKVGI